MTDSPCTKSLLVLLRPSYLSSVQRKTRQRAGDDALPRRYWRTLMTMTSSDASRRKLPFHLSPLDFDISDLELLTSEQLGAQDSLKMLLTASLTVFIVAALVQYHADCDETVRVKVSSS